MYIDKICNESPTYFLTKTRIATLRVLLRDAPQLLVWEGYFDFRHPTPALCQAGINIPIFQSLRGFLQKVSPPQIFNPEYWGAVMIALPLEVSIGYDHSGHMQGPHILPGAWSSRSPYLVRQRVFLWRSTMGVNVLMEGHLGDESMDNRGSNIQKRSNLIVCAPKLAQS